MGRMISKKLRSSKGASLTFALLAFLVCAVISAVLLASASAATGRLSNLAETDQRYYAVTSAAQLFCDTLNGQEFTIERKHTNYQVNVMRYITDDNGVAWGNRVTDPDEIAYWFGNSIRDKLPDSDNANVFSFYATGLSEPITDKKDEGSEPSDAELINKVRAHSILANAALSYVIGVPTKSETGTLNLITAMEAYGNPPGSSFPATTSGGAVVANPSKIEIGTFDVECTGDLPANLKDLDFLKVTATAKLRKDGSIVIEFSNAGAEPYIVTVTLTAEASDNSDQPLTVSSDNTYFRFDPGTVSGPPCSYECTVTTTVKTKTTTIKWNVTDIKKGAEGDA